MIAGRKSRERERQHGACTRIFCLGFFFLESRNTMFGSTNQSASDEDPCADPESYVRGGLTLTTFLLFLEDDPNITKIGSSSARQRNAI